MAIQQYGNQSYIFGFSDADANTIAASTGLTPQEGSIDKEPEVMAEGKDKFNRTNALALDDQGKKTFQLSGYVSNLQLYEAAMGTTFVYNSLVYIVTATGKAIKKDDFMMGSLTATNFSQITSSAKTLVAS
jgi:hypothetical protein